MTSPRPARTALAFVFCTVLTPRLVSAAELAYVPLVEEGDVVAVDATGSTAARIALCTRSDDRCALTAVGVGSAGSRVYVASVADLYVIDTLSNRLLDRIAVSGSAVAALDDDRVLLAGCGTDHPFDGTGPLCEVDLRARTVRRTIDFDGGTSRVSVSRDGKTAAVVVGSDGASASGSVVFLDAASLQMRRAIDLAAPIGAIVLSPEGREAYALLSLGRLAIIDASTGTWRAIEHAGGWGMTIDSAGERIYVTVPGVARDTVGIVDPQRQEVVGEIDLSRAISAGGRPFGIDISPDDERLYIAFSEDYFVMVVDARSGEVVGRSSGLGEAPYSIAVADVPDAASRGDGCETRTGTAARGTWWILVAAAAVCLAVRARGASTPRR